MIDAECERQARYALEMARHCADFEARRLWLAMASEWTLIGTVGEDYARLMALTQKLKQGISLN